MKTVNEFEVGDIVQHVLGGPHQIVSEIGEDDLTLCRAYKSQLYLNMWVEPNELVLVEDISKYKLPKTIFKVGDFVALRSDLTSKFFIKDILDNEIRTSFITESGTINRLSFSKKIAKLLFVKTK